MATIGIIGAGKVGTAVARLAVAAGDEVLLVGSPNAQFLEQIVAVTAPGARVASINEVADAAKLTILAVPFGKLDTVDLERFNGAIVVDATNYWEAVDGTPALLSRDSAGTSGHDSASEIVQALNPAMRVVKSLNHLGYHDIDTDGRPPAHPERRAVAVAGDHQDANDTVAAFLDRIGFDPVDIGPLSNGVVLQTGQPVFGTFVQRAELEALATGGEEIAA